MNVEELVEAFCNGLVLHASAVTEENARIVAEAMVKAKERGCDKLVEYYVNRFMHREEVRDNHRHHSNDATQRLQGGLREGLRAEVGAVIEQSKLVKGLKEVIEYLKALEEVEDSIDHIEVRYLGNDDYDVVIAVRW